MALLTSCTENYGILVNWEIDLRPDIALFSESQSRILLSISPDNTELVEVAMQKKGVPCARIGKVVSSGTSGSNCGGSTGRFDISLNGTPVIQADLNPLRELWKNAIGREMEISV